MAQKENKIMEKKDAVAAMKLVETLLKQKQSFLNLDSGEDDEITVTTKKYTVPDGMDVAAAMKQAQTLVQPVERQLAALLKFAESESYQESKNSALTKGNYLTSGIKSKLVQILQTSDTFANMKAKDVFERWYTGYKSADVKKKAAANKVLDRARASEEYDDL